MSVENAKSFIIGYYHTLISRQQDLAKFYSPEPKIWRKSADSTLAIQINEKVDTIFPKVDEKSDFNLIDFTICPRDKDVVVHVYGNVTLEGAKKFFVQTFTLLEKDGITSVVDDMLYFSHPNSILSPGDELYEHSTRSQPKQTRSNQFAPYTPGK